MPHNPFEWPEDGSGAIIQQHSVAKLEVLRAYLVAYFQTLAASHRQEEIRLTLVDGFAGGGVFRHADTNARILGSPFVFLKAAEEAQAIMNANRGKPLRFNLNYIFIEKSAKAHRALLAALKLEGYGERLNVDIHVIHSAFEDQVDRVIAAVRRLTPNTGRAIIALDQYGYSDVPTSLIRKLLVELPRSEIVLTFAVDAFINFASDNDATRGILARLGLSKLLDGTSIEEIKAQPGRFRFRIQSRLYQELTRACDARYYTLFFIRTGGHGDYWLVHLSQHPRARDVMSRVHWENNNHFVHYGGAGLDMFRAIGYDANLDEGVTGQSAMSFEFDETANDASIRMLTEQLTPLIHDHKAISFADLYASNCNTTPADSARFKTVLGDLIAHKEILITSPTGKVRRKASTIGDADLIQRSHQRSFFDFAT